MKPCVFIHTNHKQIVGALVAQYALRRNSRHADQFDVRIIHTEDYPFLQAREGQVFLRDAAHLSVGDIVPVTIEDADEHDLYGVPA